MRLNSRTCCRAMAATSCAVLIAIGSHAAAQSPAVADTAEASARAAILRLFEATRRADWKAMQPYFPADTEWERIIEKLVSEQDRRPQSYSFWFRGVGIPEDSLSVHMFSPDSALITTPFRVRGARAEWTATLVRGPRQWVLASTMESFGGRRSSILP